LEKVQFQRTNSSKKSIPNKDLLATKIGGNVAEDHLIEWNVFGMQKNLISSDSFTHIKQ